MISRTVPLTTVWNSARRWFTNCRSKSVHKLRRGPAGTPVNSVGAACAPNWASKSRPTLSFQVCAPR
ncbi:hypothetical protein ACFQ9X_38390 [Catenulispora yoronensis]